MRVRSSAASGRLVGFTGRGFTTQAAQVVTFCAAMRSHFYPSPLKIELARNDGKMMDRCPKGTQARTETRLGVFWPITTLLFNVEAPKRIGAANASLGLRLDG